MTLKYSKQVYYWLITGCVLVSIMVVVGGITRLTHSGLSIVEWKPITGIIPPLNEAAWQVEFEKYQNSPEFKYLHNHFNVDDFKQIYFWEYLHRLIARVIGLVFIFPFIIFLYKKKFNNYIRNKIFFIFLLGILQAVFGWLMVKSGLSKDPHVSHYRLAVHFIFALFLISLIYYTALEYKHGVIKEKWGGKLKTFLVILLCLIFVQFVYGAFVSGLKAGLIYNTFPKLGSAWLPDELIHYYREFGGISLLKNGGWVQFMHRFFALLILLFTIFLNYYSFKNKNVQLTKSLLIFDVLLLTQIVLGILTLLSHVQITLAILHQFVAILITIQMCNLFFFTRKSKR